MEAPLLACALGAIHGVLGEGGSCYLGIVLLRRRLCQLVRLSCGDYDAGAALQEVGQASAATEECMLMGVCGMPRIRSCTARQWMARWRPAGAF